MLRWTDIVLRHFVPLVSSEITGLGVYSKHNVFVDRVRSVRPFMVWALLHTPNNTSYLTHMFSSHTLPCSIPTLTLLPPLFPLSPLSSFSHHSLPSFITLFPLSPLSSLFPNLFLLSLLYVFPFPYSPHSNSRFLCFLFCSQLV